MNVIVFELRLLGSGPNTGCFSFYLFVLFCFLIITRHLNAGMKINDVVVVAVDIGIDSMDYYYCYF